MKPPRKKFTVEVAIEERDIQMLQLRAEGYSAKEIGKAVCLSGRTVEFRTDALKQLLGAKNSYHLIYLAVKQQLIT